MQHAGASGLLHEAAEVGAPAACLVPLLAPFRPGAMHVDRPKQPPTAFRGVLVTARGDERSPRPPRSSTNGNSPARVRCRCCSSLGTGPRRPPAAQPTAGGSAKLQQADEQPAAAKPQWQPRPPSQHLHWCDTMCFMLSDRKRQGAPRNTHALACIVCINCMSCILVPSQKKQVGLLDFRWQHVNGCARESFRTSSFAEILL